MGWIIFVVVLVAGFAVVVFLLTRFESEYPKTHVLQGLSDDSSDHKERVVRQVLQRVANDMENDLETGRMEGRWSKTDPTQAWALYLFSGTGGFSLGWVKADPDNVLTLWADIGQFEHLRPKPSFGEWVSSFKWISKGAQTDREREWPKKPLETRGWEGIEAVVSRAFKEAFITDANLDVVRFWIGDVAEPPYTWRVSAAAGRDGPLDWRYERGTGSSLTPITPHGEEAGWWRFSR